MSDSTLSVISAIGGLIGALGGAFAAFAAFRSAGAADRATRHAQAVEKRGLIRDVLGTAHAVVAECVRIEDLYAQLERAYKDLATFAGQSGGSRQELFMNEAKKKLTETQPLRGTAEKWISNKPSLQGMGEENLTEALTELEGALAQCRRLKEQFVHELASIEQQITTFREQAISGQS